MKTILMLLIAILPAVTQTSDPLARQIKRDEGLRRAPYQDIMNRLVVGYGHKLDAHCEHRASRKDDDKPGLFHNAAFEPPTTLPTSALEAEIVEAEYLGTLEGDQTIGLTLVHDPDKRLHGVYFYRKYLTDIPVEGEFTGERDIVLREHNSDGSLRGTFQLHFAEHDPRYQLENSPDLNHEILLGTWTDAKGSRSRPILLDMQTMWDTDVMAAGREHPYASTPELEQNVKVFYSAVLKGDKLLAASYADYPLRINAARVRIVHSKAEFLRFYSQIFTKKYVTRIGQAIPHHIWGNVDGWMIADGAVWFDETGKVTVLNVCKPKLHSN